MANEDLERAAETPCVWIDLDKVERNIAAMQKLADAAGLKLRPHAKTHKMPKFAMKQLEAGASGITVAKVGEAEVMADGGIRDIMIAYPIVGEAKLKRAARLAKRIGLTVALDSYEVALGLSRAMQEEGAEAGVLIELDPGYGRAGVQTPQAAGELAERILGLPGLDIRGILTFAGQSYDAADDDGIRQVALAEGRLAAEAAEELRSKGVRVRTVSVGSTPASRFCGLLEGVTEIRPGTYIFGDLTQVKAGALQVEDCALTVKVTVVSRPAPDRAVIDAGTKVFTSDGEDSPVGTGRGYVLEHPDITVEWFNEEHGILHLPEGCRELSVGDCLHIIPVHCCAVVNMFDEVWVQGGGRPAELWKVEARGKVR